MSRTISARGRKPCPTSRSYSTNRAFPEWRSSGIAWGHKSLSLSRLNAPNKLLLSCLGGLRKSPRDVLGSGFDPWVEGEGSLAAQ